MEAESDMKIPPYNVQNAMHLEMGSDSGSASWFCLSFVDTFLVKSQFSLGFKTEVGETSVLKSIVVILTSTGVVVTGGAGAICGGNQDFAFLERLSF